MIFLAVLFLIIAIMSFSCDVPVTGVVFLLGMVYFIWMAITEINDNKPAFDPKKYKSKFVDEGVKAAIQPQDARPVIKSEKTLIDVASNSDFATLYELPSREENEKQMERWKQLHEIAGGEFKNNRNK